MATKCVLHIPGLFTRASLPVEPCFAKKFFQDPTIDITASVVPNIYNQTLTLEDRIVISGPLRDVIPAHRAKVDVANFVVARFLDLEAAGIFPFGVAEVLLRIWTFRSNDCFEVLAGIF